MSYNIIFEPRREKRRGINLIPMSVYCIVAAMEQIDRLKNVFFFTKKMIISKMMQDIFATKWNYCGEIFRINLILIMFLN